MFYYLQKNKIIQSLILLGLVIYTVINLYFSPITYILEENSSYVYRQFVHFIMLHDIWFYLIFIVNIVLQLILLHSFFQRNNFTEEKSWMSLIWYLFFLNFAVDINQITPAFFTNTVIIVLLHLNVNNSPVNLKNKVTLSGMLIALNSLLDVTSGLLLLFLITSLLISRFSKFKDVLIAIIGFFIPYLYLFSIYFLQDRLLNFFETYQNIQLFSLFNSGNFSILHILIASFALFLMIFLSLIVKINYDNKLIILRKRVISLALLLLTTVIMILFTDIPIKSSLNYLFVPIALYFSIIHSITKHAIVNDIIVILICASLILLPIL